MKEESNSYKVIILGEKEVGKLGILTRFIFDNFNPNNSNNKSPSNYYSKKLKLSEEKEITLDVWHISGHEKYRTLTKTFCKGAKAIILVYDITNNRSFTEIKDYWSKQIKEYCENDIVLVISANKSDLYDEMQVDDEIGKEFAKSIGAFFFSTSAKDGSNIKDMFEYMGNKILDPNFIVKAEKKIPRNLIGTDGGPDSIPPRFRKKHKCVIY